MSSDPGDAARRAVHPDIYVKEKIDMEYERLIAILHGHRLGEPLTWVYLAALAAVAIAGWKLGGILFDACHRSEDE